MFLECRIDTLFSLKPQHLLPCQASICNNQYVLLIGYSLLPFTMYHSCLCHQNIKLGRWKKLNVVGIEIHYKVRVLQVRVDWGSHILESNLASLAKAVVCPPTTQPFHSWKCILEKVSDWAVKGICELGLMSVIYGGKLGGHLGVLL